MSTKIPIYSSHLDTMSSEEYQLLQQRGYTETSSKEIIYMNKRGTLVKVKKPISSCERMARLAGCAFVTPFALFISLFTCNQCEAVELSIDHCFGPGMDGAFIEVAFLEDQQKTTELRDKDFQALGYDSFSKDNITKLAESEKFPKIQSSKCPQHYYMSFYGPYSTLSYIIVIPNGDTKNVHLYPVCNKEKKPCNGGEIQKKGEILCQGYKLGVKKVKVITETVLVKTSTVTGSHHYGTIRINKYEGQERIVS